MQPALGVTLDADSDEAYEHLYGPVRQRWPVPDRTAAAPVPRDRPSRPAPPAGQRRVADPLRREQHGRRQGGLPPAPWREPETQRAQPRDDWAPAPAMRAPQ